MIAAGRILGQVPRLDSTLFGVAAVVHRSCSSNTSRPASVSVDTEDVRRHGRLADDWWKANGPMRALHTMNRIRWSNRSAVDSSCNNWNVSFGFLRVPFIRDGLIGTGRVSKELSQTAKSLSGIQVLEVGCGAGILTEVSTFNVNL